jgi:hypothetical protein
VFENRVLRDILGPKREEVRGDWRKLYNIAYVERVVRRGHTEYCG